MAQEEEIRYFVRISNTDLDGTKAVHIALTGIRGVGMHTAQVIAQLAGIDEKETMGKISDDQVNRLREVVDAYTQKVPPWMMNRPKDIYTGEAKHLFGPDVTMARDEDINILKGTAENLRRLNWISGVAEGHTDSVGPEDYNQRLSERRAQSVIDFLATQGIGEARIRAVGFGESKPIADNATREGRAQNRRVVLRRTDCDEMK
jgi:small subunit ribosomal protein S13